MISEPKLCPELIFQMTSYTKGGMSAFGSEIHPQPKNPFAVDNYHDWMVKGLNQNREGWFGWGGIGGSIMMFHPEHKIGFSYVPTDLFLLDFSFTRGSLLQKLAVEAIEAKKLLTRK